jgi:hypothetical protein
MKIATENTESERGAGVKAAKTLVQLLYSHFFYGLCTRRPKKHRRIYVTKTSNTDN